MCLDFLYKDHKQNLQARQNLCLSANTMAEILKLYPKTNNFSFFAFFDFWLFCRAGAALKFCQIKQWSNKDYEYAHVHLCSLLSFFKWAVVAGIPKPAPCTGQAQLAGQASWLLAHNIMRGSFEDFNILLLLSLATMLQAFAQLRCTVGVFYSVKLIHKLQQTKQEKGFFAV